MEDVEATIVVRKNVRVWGFGWMCVHECACVWVCVTACVVAEEGWFKRQGTGRWCLLRRVVDGVCAKRKLV